MKPSPLLWSEGNQHCHRIEVTIYIASALNQNEEQVVQDFMEYVNSQRKERGLSPVSFSTAVQMT